MPGFPRTDDEFKKGESAATITLRDAIHSEFVKFLEVVWEVLEHVSELFFRYALGVCGDGGKDLTNG
ncbi:unnamed protein product [Clonostachys byssicola]|uniref:Uncharacterized protein n=1 Tax=Clonostachys byssicola TaxID=160290 RepID=A0A9N9YB29_9HYPO|nr:unnamed protein product [Clonostachys byssicola]